MKFDKVCVLGLGYIGLPTASTFATHGLHVIGVDNNPRVVSTLRNGELHISEPGLGKLVKEALSAGRLVISDTPESADAFIIAVPTPFYNDEQKVQNGREYRLADMRAVTAATQSILPHLRRGNLVVLESTSPPRTTLDLVKPILEGLGLKAGVDFLLAYSPERVLPGRILQELTENARVIGGINAASAEAGRDLYAHFVRGEIVLTDATTAEMVKLMENTYRDINIAIANEFSRLAQRFSVDIWEAIGIANRHPRVKILNPGPGVGGHCISVDPWFLVEAAPDLTELIIAARHLNDTQPHFVFDLISGIFDGKLPGKHIGLLGLAFKPDVDDLRESPAIEVARLLTEAGVILSAYEPNKPDASIPGVTLSLRLEDAIRDTDLLCLLVGHKELKELDPAWVRQVSSARWVIDTVGAWDKESWSSAGFTFLRLGDGKQDR
ncbi:MAG: UDP-N-acetyl-D-mannosamine dehydrogenase [Anaerolineales bacterium]|nr:nucleotide sugar dehydrogenase [Anaerolineae bacterium]PWB52249.1 MAG: UDP-N-acetyl-D-mannosamine dehydrogenase [Anaerolineales bacterium]